MHISRIVIRNFRNFKMLNALLNPGVTCVVGENNTGKSNLLQALRLPLDAGMSSVWRQLSPEDFPVGTEVRTPQQVVISVEFSGFAGKPHEEAMMLGCHLADDQARITYRFRPRREVRDAIANGPNPGNALTLEDYRWEICGGGDADVAMIEWNEDLGISIRMEELQQSFLVVFLEPLRDVEQRLKQSRLSPLAKLLTPADIPDAEQQALVTILTQANSQIADSTTIKSVGRDITDSFGSTAGSAFKMGVRLGMAPATFGDISRGLNVLLSNNAMKDFDPGRNGLGLNNVLYISMVLKYFERRVTEAKTAGQLLMIEEPEAHLHPQLQRVLFASLQERQVQTIVTTHSTHITSQAPLASVLVLTNDGTTATASSVPVADVPLVRHDVQDLERYLDATRCTLLYARRVMLVEGPAELFLIGPLVRRVMNVNLDEYGISVVPIFGVHFAAYTKLFGPRGITKRCAVVADGDLTPSDACDVGEGADMPELPNPPKPELTLLENAHVKVFTCTTTFERALTDKGTMTMFADAAQELGAPQIAALLRTIRDSLPDSGQLTTDQRAALEKAQGAVLNTAKRYGKARFAQVASEHVDKATSIPSYLRDAVQWLMA